jgi:signal transduction histidine kinase
MTPEHDPALEERVLVSTPTRRDADVTCALLARSGIACEAFTGLGALAGAIHAGVGVVVLTDAALVGDDIERVFAALAGQPAWSDVPVILLTPDRRHSAATTRALDAFTNVTLLDRPVSTRSMLSAVLAALRARRRQYQIRDQMRDLRAAEHALREADRRKDEFLATLAHELRNPLAPIRTGLDVLARIPGDGAQAERVRAMMQRQLTQLVKLIDELLDVSRIATGKVVLRREPVDLRSVIESAIEGSQPLVAEAGHHLEVIVPPDPVVAFGDPTRLSQVVGNLVNNAAKYTPPGGRIEVSLALEGDEAVIRVSDNGVGIPADMLVEVFDMFAQVDQTIGQSHGGLGIGLSLVRRLVALHGGSVAAASAGRHQGSTFTVRLQAFGTRPVQG